MSRAYRVRWVKASRSVTAGDRLKMNVDLLDILPQDDMRALLAAELKADGWKREEDGSWSVVHEGVHVRLSADASELVLTVDKEQRVTASAVSERDAERQADAAAESATERLQTQAAEALAKVEPDVRERFGKALQRAYVEALKRKAASLGDVESMQENRRDDGEVEIVIKVKA
jgi:hypothetical protein